MDRKKVELAILTWIAGRLTSVLRLMLYAIANRLPSNRDEKTGKDKKTGAKLPPDGDRDAPYGTEDGLIRKLP